MKSGERCGLRNEKVGRLVQRAPSTPILDARFHMRVLSQCERPAIGRRAGRGGWPLEFSSHQLGEDEEIGRDGTDTQALDCQYIRALDQISDR